MSDINCQSVITQCKNWVDEFIIKWGICPFARAVMESNDIGYEIINDEDTESQVMALMGHVQLMKSEAVPDTKLLILPHGVSEFESFLTLVDIANEILEQQNETDFIQIASFHPDYLFEGEAADSPSHFTNRAPWPMLHLIRQSSMAKALENFPEPEMIPQRNINLMMQIGYEKLTQQLKLLRQSDNL